MTHYVFVYFLWSLQNIVEDFFNAHRKEREKEEEGVEENFLACMKLRLCVVMTHKQNIIIARK